MFVKNDGQVKFICILTFHKHYKTKIADSMKLSLCSDVTLQHCTVFPRRKSVKIFIRGERDKPFICSDTLNGKNLRKTCVTLQWHRPFRYFNGQFDWGPTSRNDIVSSFS